MALAVALGGGCADHVHGPGLATPAEAGADLLGFAELEARRLVRVEGAVRPARAWVDLDA